MKKLALTLIMAFTMSPFLKAAETAAREINSCFDYAESIEYVMTDGANDNFEAFLMAYDYCVEYMEFF